MSNRKKRTYTSATREAQAAQTKGRILDCAKRLFESEGYEGMTIEKLAQTAEVSTPTIYALFQSKRGILFALMDEALPTEQHRSLVERGKNEKSAKARLKIAAKISRQLYDAEREQMAIFHGASMLSPEFREIEREKERRRYQRQEETIETLAKENFLAEGLSLSKARDLLWAFTGRDLYRMFVVEQGWSPEDYEQWLGEILIKNLLKEI
jgi:AcrR family transcriptional regulator